MGSKSGLRSRPALAMLGRSKRHVTKKKRYTLDGTLGDTNMDSEIVLTPSALLEFLLQIDELSGMEVGVSESLDGNIEVSIGDSDYIIDCSDAEHVSVDDSVVDTISDIDESNYDEIVDNYDNVDGSSPSDDEAVEGGILKEIAKTLAIGGLARLSGNVLKDMLH